MRSYALDVACTGRVDDLLRQRRRCRVRATVPAGFGAREPVAHELLVETGLYLARFVAFERPVARRVGGEHLVGEHEVSTGVETEFELGVRKDDSAIRREVGGAGINVESVLAKLHCQLLADLLHYLIEADVLVVIPESGLGRRGEDRVGQPRRLDEALRQRDAAHCAGVVVVDQAGAGEEATNYAFDGNHVEGAHHESAAENLFRDTIVVGLAGQVVGATEDVEEEHAHRGEHATPCPGSAC